MEKIKIAILLTCFNRLQHTLECLQNVYDQINCSEINFSFHLTDDGSTDGTSECVLEKFPEVRVLHGNGDLFWAGGMRKSFEDAKNLNPDFYLWLNDDTNLFPDAICQILTSYMSVRKNTGNPAIIVGSTRDPLSLETTYGGVRIKYRWWPLKYKLVEPSENSNIACDTMNGNCVLIPREIVNDIGIIDPAFTHYLADHDYGLRAKHKGYGIWICTGHTGTCEKSKISRSLEQKRGIRESLRSLDSPKGFHINGTDLTSLQEWKIYCKRHGGILWPIYWLAPYRRLIRTLLKA